MKSVFVVVAVAVGLIVGFIVGVVVTVGLRSVAFTVVILVVRNITHSCMKKKVSLIPLHLSKNNLDSMFTLLLIIDNDD